MKRGCCRVNPMRAGDVLMGSEVGRIRLTRVAAADEARPGLRRLRLVGSPASEAERGRLLDAICAVAGEIGYRQTTVRMISDRAGVSHRVFYELFRDREDCLLAAFDRDMDGLALTVLPAWKSERLVFAEALAAGQRVLARRAAVLGRLAEAIDEGRTGHERPDEIPPLAAEGMVGAAFTLIHSRLCDPRCEGVLVELLGPLMAMIVLPYRGREAAASELTQVRGFSGASDRQDGVDTGSTRETALVAQ
jgi:AcrR family transcriptional regulator